MSQFPSLNFLVYVPKRSESPLYIRSDSEGRSVTDNFLVPQWGGMVIYNRNEVSDLESSESGKNQSRDSGKECGDSGVVCLEVEMRKLMPVFVDHLKMLLGVPDRVKMEVSDC